MMRQVILQRAALDLQRCVVAVARRYDLSATEMIHLLLQQADEATRIALDAEAALDMADASQRAG